MPIPYLAHLAQHREHPRHAHPLDAGDTHTSNLNPRDGFASWPLSALTRLATRSIRRQPAAIPFLKGADPFLSGGA
jgi:hypothetical protein